MKIKNWTSCIQDRNNWNLYVEKGKTFSGWSCSARRRSRSRRGRERRRRGRERRRRIIFFCDAKAPSGPGPPHFRGFIIKFRHITLGRAPLDEWSVRRSYLYLSTQTFIRNISMSPAGFECVVPASERLQTHALNRIATGIGSR